MKLFVEENVAGFLVLIISCLAEVFGTHYPTVSAPTWSVVALWWAAVVAGGLHSVEDLLELLIGQKHAAVRQPCVPTGLCVLQS